MKIAEVMTKQVHLLNPDQSIRDAARKMSEEDLGALPIADGDHLVGMITDRDIAVRVVAEDKSTSTKIGDVMSREVKYCFDDEDLDHVSENMADIQMRRLPVMNRQKQLVGIVALGDLATKADGPHAGRALGGISQRLR